MISGAMEKSNCRPAIIPQKIILASANPDKAKEFQKMLPENLYQVIPMHEAGFSDAIEENGASYQENALIKARAVFSRLGGLVLADDSGLSIDVLQGAPGLYSARFAGEGADYPTKISCLYRYLRPWPPNEWLASFVCALALIKPDGSEITVVRECRGLIAPHPRGSNGFGYDPIFLLPDRGKTMAELPEDEKNEISHRGQALRALASLLLDRD
ncbi:MAG: RdgB/HAM1 family non-canonical purine NTP pyrophosphatase [Clostridiaceae bacterium]|nr:RdgB/HAM1 family non-canonical purine NTP pyrophosphatase [Clostridiaceae bacterium]